MSRQVMEMALDCLLYYNRREAYPRPESPTSKTIDALRAALAETEAPKAEPVDEEVIGEFYGVWGNNAREWWSGGAWLYPGDTVVVRRAVAKETPAALPELSDEDAQIARAWDRFTAELENPSPLTDEEILEMWSPSLDGSVQRPILGKNKIIAFARSVLAAARGKG